MIHSLYIYESSSFDPYENLAVEKYLLDTVPEDGCILYLWQNQNTVVIGRNQNPWVECRTSLLEQEGGRLARRLSGGGAVFHDLGNLNFTFLMGEENYDLEKQLGVIRTACLLAGIQTEFSGRNDILANGQKFSGNAFFHTQGKAYHHGTLLINVDMDKLSRYLSPSKAKLESKGVASVRSRVVNLKSLNKDLTCDTMKAYMRQAFEQVYGMPAKTVELSPAAIESIRRFRQNISSWDYLYGKPLPFSLECQGHFLWGHIQLQICASGGVITQTKAYSDAMDWQLTESIENALTGCRFRLDAITTALKNALPPQESQDICELLANQDL